MDWLWIVHREESWWSATHMSYIRNWWKDDAVEMKFDLWIKWKVQKKHYSKILFTGYLNVLDSTKILSYISTISNIISYILDDISQISNLIINYIHPLQNDPDVKPDKLTVHTPKIFWPFSPLLFIIFCNTPTAMKTLLHALRIMIVMNVYIGSRQLFFYSFSGVTSYTSAVIFVCGLREADHPSPGP